MRKLAVITGAALALAGTWTAVAGQYNDISTQPSANAYVSMDFGHPNPARALTAPVHYGLRMSYDQRLRAFDGGSLPALAQWDFDTRGNRIAMVGGIPFMAHIRPPMRQAEDDGSAPAQQSGVGPEGLDFFDLSLLVVGIGGIGYLIYEVAKNDDSPAETPPATTGGLLGGLLGGSTTGGLLGGLLGGGTGGTTGGTTGSTTTGGLLGGLLGGGGYASGAQASADRDIERLRWLDGGTGHMGDLQKQ